MTSLSSIDSGDRALDGAIAILNHPGTRFARLIAQSRTGLGELLRRAEEIGFFHQVAGDEHGLSARFCKGEPWATVEGQRTFRDFVSQLLARGATVTLQAEVGGI